MQPGLLTELVVRKEFLRKMALLRVLENEIMASALWSKVREQHEYLNKQAPIHRQIGYSFISKGATPMVADYVCNFVDKHNLRPTGSPFELAEYFELGKYIEGRMVASDIVVRLVFGNDTPTVKAFLFLTYEDTDQVVSFSYGVRNWDTLMRYDTIINTLLEGQKICT